MRQSRVSKQNAVVVAVCAVLMIAELCPSAVVAARYVAISPRSKPRSTRGFKSDTLNIARSFGKRGSAGDMPAFMGDSLTVARNYGKRAPGFAVTAGRFPDISQHSAEVPFTGDNLDTTIGEAFADKLTDSFPLDWFVEEMQNNPDLARTVLHKFVDANGDGYLSADELLRPVVF